MSVRLQDVCIARQSDTQSFRLSNVSIEIEPGEFVVIVGPSGVGKTSLLRAIAGLLPVEVGNIMIADEAVQDKRPADRNIAMVFQQHGLFPHMTVAQNLGLSLLFNKAKKTEIQQRVDQIAALLQLTELLDAYPQTLSGGQKQRVAIGRAMLSNPKVFLFDEPLVNLDPTLRRHMLRELKQLHQRLGATSLYVTHDQSEALALADKILLLDTDGIVQFASPSECYNQPANQYIAEFLGEPPINLLPFAHPFTQTFGTSQSAYTDPSALPILFGIRPRQVKLLIDGEGETVDMVCQKASVTAISQLGEDVLIQACVAGIHEPVSLFCQASTQLPSLHQKVSLGWRKADMLLFDQQGRRLALAPC